MSSAVSLLLVVSIRLNCIKGLTTASPRLSVCVQKDVDTVLNKDFCQNSAGQTLLHTGKTVCILSVGAPTQGKPALKKCSEDDLLDVSFVKDCKPGWAKERNKIVCLYRSIWYWWDKHNDICRIPKGTKILQMSGRNVTVCPTAVFRNAPTSQGVRLEVPVCEESQFMKSNIATKTCEDKKSNHLLKTTPGNTKCLLVKDKLPRVINLKLSENAPPKCLKRPRAPMVASFENVPPLFKEAVAICPDNLGKRQNELGLESCIFGGGRGPLLTWDTVRRKVCHRIVAYILLRYGPCRQEVIIAVHYITSLASRQVDTDHVRPCKGHEANAFGTRDFSALHNCFFRGDYYRWYALKKDICKLSPGNKPKFSQWIYCSSEAVDHMQNVTRTPGEKRRAIAAMALLDLAEQPAKTAKYYDDLEEEIRDWVQESLSLSGTSVRNIEFTDQPGTSRDTRAAGNTSRQKMRRLSQTPDSVFAKFTVVVDSRQVQGIDFADELERSMKENAHKFDGPGGNFQIDPSSIQVKEVSQNRISSSSSDDYESTKHIIILVVICGCLSIAISTGILLLWKRRCQSHRIGKIAHR